ncbi:MAG: M1 family metallopeptidase [Nannocystis sp.]|nr:M1 family metallopeptidase [Nannocystis sp.]
MSSPPSAPVPATPPAPALALPAPHTAGQDPHSFARPDEARVRHVGLDLDVDFEAQVLIGAATLKIDRAADAQELVLDTRDLTIVEVATGTAPATASDAPLRLASRPELSWTPASWRFGGVHPALGTPLHITLPAGADLVRIRYRSAPNANGLQWLGPEQTADRIAPFLYTQSQAINARSWVPVQDSPGVRITFDARISAPATTRPVMAAESLGTETEPGGRIVHRFALDQAVPSYLLALAVGRLESASTGPRTGVWAEPGVLARAKAEFADMEAMLTSTESQFGPYRWGRYEVLVLPPAFPFGGMENPRVTFVTPTILAGDRSLVALIAHELAHSWSGNLVSNATWRDLWLNEGFTVYIERRIVEAVYGAERAEIQAVLGRQDLMRTLDDLAERPGDQVLHVELAGRDPDDVFSDVPYEKGYLFLRRLEQTFGRPAFDGFVQRWFAAHAFTSQTTGSLQAFLDAELLTKHPALPGQTAPDVALWLSSPGLLPDAPQPHSPALDAVGTAAVSLARGETPTRKLDITGWSPQHWIFFLRALPLAEVDALRVLGEIDAAFHLTDSTNNEVLGEWLVLAAKYGYRAADARMDRFLIEVGRRKYLTPIYTALLATAAGQQLAHSVYPRARIGYHPITRHTLDALLGHIPASSIPASTIPASTIPASTTAATPPAEGQKG